MYYTDCIYTLFLKAVKSKTTPKIDFFANVQTGSAGASKSEILQVIRKECASTGEAIGVKEIAVILGCDDSKVRKSLQKILSNDCLKRLRFLKNK